jgi:hypothetical protein
VYRGQRVFRSRQRSSAHVDTGPFSGDRDLLTGRGVATLARRLDPDRHLDQPADPHLLGVAEFIEHNPINRRERPSSAASAQPGAAGHRIDKLHLC